MLQIETEQMIDAPPDVVWQHFVHKARWRDFSGFTDLAPAHPIAQGGIVWFALQLLPGPPTPVRVRVIRCDRPREVRWVGGLPAFPLFRGEHYFRFEDAGDGRTRFVHGERFFGPLAGLFMRLLGDRIRLTYIAFNSGLARQAEASPIPLTPPAPR